MRDSYKEIFEDWVYDNRLTIEWEETDVFRIDGVGKFFLLDHNDQPIFDSELCLIIHDTDEDELIDEGIEFIVYQFGDNFYYTKIEAEPAEMNIFRYLGDCDYEVYEEYTNLGVHGKYELLNGSSDYSIWVEKAKFFGMAHLGICEKNTLAGTLPFQTASKKSGIHPVFGMSMDVKFKEEGRFDCKVYALTQNGWQNLLRISYEVNVVNWEDKHIDFDVLSKYGEGIAFVFGKSWIPETKVVDLAEIYFDSVFYQLDSASFLSNKIDTMHLDYLQRYFEMYGKNMKLRPILLSDTYYLEQSEYQVKKMLNKIQVGASHAQSSDQYFKHFEDHFDTLEPLFKSQDQFEDIICEAVDNTMELAESAKVTIDTSGLHLPVYEMNREERRKYNEDPEHMFITLLEDGFSKLVPEGQEELYRERLNKEIYVIRDKGSEGVKNERGFIDYFLILWDIIKYCKKNGIYVGPGRGSAAGSLVSYLLGITQVDPIKYNLIFERFLNEKRVASGLPDIDVDFESDRRQDVKNYMKQRYGHDHVFSIGTYGTLKIKAAIKDIGRVKGVNAQTMLKVSKMIPEKEAGMTFREFFVKCQKVKGLKKFINEHPQVIELLRVIMGQPKSQSIHAAAMVITPKVRNGEPMQCYDWTPIKMHDGVLVSEWEGGMIEDAGFLKEDILAIDALDKQHHMIDLIKANHGIEIDLNDIPIDDHKAYSLFEEGVTQDVFQFNSEGMTAYVKDMKPQSIEDLAAANALYRPATMSIDAHSDFVKKKNGEIEVEYDWGLEEVTKNTYGIMAYQEQMMEATRVIAGFSLVEADAVRKAMGKKIKELMDSYHEKFVEGAIKNGCDDMVARQIWNKIEKGAGYGFNKSHAVAYSLVGYRGAWFKANWPVAFYTAALQRVSEEKMPELVAEINNSSDVEIVPPSVNIGRDYIYTDFNTGKIYWALNKIKYVAVAAVNEIIKERETNGVFESFNDFITRMKGKSINKRQIIHMILSGCFDDVEGIDHLYERYILIKEYHDFRKQKINPIEFPEDMIKKSFFWSMKQNESSGLGTINFKSIYQSSGSSSRYKSISYLDPSEINDEKKLDKVYFVCATLVDVAEYQSKRGPFGKLTLQANDVSMSCTVWNDVWEDERGTVMKSVGKVLIGNVKVYNDEYWKCHSLMSYPKTKFEFL